MAIQRSFLFNLVVTNVKEPRDRNLKSQGSNLLNSLLIVRHLQKAKVIDNPFFKIAVILSLVCLITIIVIIAVVDPNRLKGPLQNDFEVRYQRSLTIKGPIRWSLFPLSWQASNITISNKLPHLNENEQLLIIKEIRLVPQLLASLFTGRLWLCVDLKDAHVNLARSKLEDSNWQNLLNWETTLQGLQQFLNASKKKSRIVICGLTLEKGSLKLQDEMSGKNCLIQDITLQTSDLLKGILGKSAPLFFSFKIDDTSENTVKNIEFKANWELGPFYQSLKIHDIDFTVSQTAKTVPATQLAIEKKMAENPNPKVLTKLSGELEIVDSNNAPLIEGRIKAAKLDSRATFIIL